MKSHCCIWEKEKNSEQNHDEFFNYNRCWMARQQSTREQRETNKLLNVASWKKIIIAKRKVIDARHNRTWNTFWWQKLVNHHENMSIKSSPLKDVIVESKRERRNFILKKLISTLSNIPFFPSSFSFAFWFFHVLSCVAVIWSHQVSRFTSQHLTCEVWKQFSFSLKLNDLKAFFLLILFISQENIQRSFSIIIIIINKRWTKQFQGQFFVDGLI